MDITGANKQIASIERSVTEAVFTRNGDWIVAAVRDSAGTSTDIYRMRTGGGALIPAVVWPGSTERQLHCGRDGLSMLFSSDRDGRWHVYLTDTAGAAPVRITDARADHVYPVMSPSGRYIAYLSDRYSFGGNKDIWLHDLHTGDNARITANINIEDICWIDDRRLLYSAGVNLTDFNLYDLASRQTRKFIRTDAPKDFSEKKPRVVGAGARARIVYYREYLDGERQIYAVELDGTGNTRIVNSSGRDWLE
jgi:Tol biopolymer transport system component